MLTTVASLNSWDKSSINRFWVGVSRAAVASSSTMICGRDLAESEISAQIGGRGIGRPLETEGRHEAARLVHQIDDGCVVHGVAALIELNLLEIDAVRLCDCRDRGR